MFDNVSELNNKTFPQFQVITLATGYILSLSFILFSQLLVSVLRIHEILVRIRIRGSIPLTNGS
jgi:hypothetical protein